jgi:predicted DNA-binding ribbon-helix-helix protein
MLEKRSFNIQKHRTSVALEPEFWQVLEREARKEGVSLSAFIARIDAGRGNSPLASALRVRALGSWKE